MSEMGNLTSHPDEIAGDRIYSSGNVDRGAHETSSVIFQHSVDATTATLSRGLDFVFDE